MDEEIRSEETKQEETMEETQDVQEEGALAEEVDPSKEIEGLKTELYEVKDKLLRAHAEMDNMKKRSERDRQAVVKYGRESLLKDFLRVYDAIEKSIAAAKQHHPDDHSFIDGLKMTEKMMLEVLKQNHVEPITTEDAVFDPNFHDAMMQVKRDDMEKGLVLDEVEKGFMLHERVLRPAKVTVSG
ncbi:MAG: nucleotide exchange factor GrpE [Thermodesulfobacteriota bacterium]|nr:nucleotide exchange factor GrpE [Thermodesulfobacteriota bacterium]